MEEINKSYATSLNAQDIRNAIQEWLSKNWDENSDKDKKETPSLDIEKLAEYIASRVCPYRMAERLEAEAQLDNMVDLEDIRGYGLEDVEQISKQLNDNELLNQDYTDNAFRIAREYMRQLGRLKD